MPNLKCPRCDFRTGDYNEAVEAAAILTAHSTEHSSSGGSSSHARPPPVERPKLSQASPVADWKIFKSRWRSFKLATNIDESKKVHQLLGFWIQTSFIWSTVKVVLPRLFQRMSFSV